MGQSESGMLCTRGGGSPVGPKHCPEGTVMTGIAWRSGEAIDKLQGIWCKDIHQIDSPENDNNTTYYDTNWGGGGGSSNQSKCPTGYAIKTLDTSLGSTYVGGVQVGCSPFIPKNKANANHLKTNKLPLVGKKYPNKNSYWAAGETRKKVGGEDWYVSGVEARSGKMLDCVQWFGRDYGPYRMIKWSEKGQVDCCTGKNTNTTLCGKRYQPGSLDCQKVMKNYCSKNDNIIQSECQNFCTNNEYAECDNAMVEYCKRKKEAGEKDDICNCIGEYVGDTDTPLHCFYGPCTNSQAYRLINQRTGPPCGQLCQNVINLADVGGSATIDRNEFINQCSQEQVQELDKKIDPPPADDPELIELEKQLREENPDITEEEIDEVKKEAKPIQKQEEKSSYLWIILLPIIFIMIIIIIIISLWLYFRRRSPGGNISNYT